MKTTIQKNSMVRIAIHTLPVIQPFPWCYSHASFAPWKPKISVFNLVFLYWGRCCRLPAAGVIQQEESDIDNFSSL